MNALRFKNLVRPSLPSNHVGNPSFRLVEFQLAGQISADDNRPKNIIPTPKKAPSCGPRSLPQSTPKDQSVTKHTPSNQAVQVGAFKWVS